MKAAVFLGDGQCRIEDAAPASPGAHDVLIEIEGCGICASNLPLWQGRSWFEYPGEAGAPGHEPWGWVLECGERVVGLEPGMRVTGLSYHAFAEHDVAPADQLVALPPRYDRRPFPGEALACSMNIFSRSFIEKGMRVAIVGAGFLGSMLIQLSVAAGAVVIAFSKRDWSRSQALEQGAREARPLADGVAEADRNAYPRVVECTGVQAGLDVASELVAPGGRLMLAGFHQDGQRQVPMSEWNWKGIDVINAHERDPARYLAGVRAAIEALDRHLIDPWPLFTHQVSLQELDEAFRLMESRPPGFVKALACC